MPGIDTLDSRPNVSLRPSETLGERSSGEIGHTSPNEARHFNSDISGGLFKDLWSHAKLPIAGALLVTVGLIGGHHFIASNAPVSPRIEMAPQGAPIPAPEIPHMPDDIDAPQAIDRRPRLQVPVITNGAIGLPNPPTEPLPEFTDEDLANNARYNQDGRKFVEK